MKNITPIVPMPTFSVCLFFCLFGVFCLLCIVVYCIVLCCVVWLLCDIYCFVIFVSFNSFFNLTVHVKRKHNSYLNQPYGYNLIMHLVGNNS